jgi:hypothetical protein
MFAVEHFSVQSFYANTFFVGFHYFTMKFAFLFRKLYKTVMTHVINGVYKKKMLSRDCDGCGRQNFDCRRRFAKVDLGEKVFCPDGTAHLVDSK